MPELLAPAKVNLALYLGPVRDDGLHELCSLFAPLELADRLTVAPAAHDEVSCPGVEGPDLTERALAALRADGWHGEPVRIEVDKRIPVAAGLGGGSADAAAVLRLARNELGAAELARIGAGIGADVPSQIEPGFALVTGAGEGVEPLPGPDPLGAVLLPDPEGLSTPAVFVEADRLGLGRPLEELAELRERLRAAASAERSPLEYRELLHNDLAAAAVSLRPAIAGALEALGDAGAAHAFVTGSGPTAVGLFAAEAGAEEAARRLRAAGRQAIATRCGTGS
jgi:4-diphosphocytidyl-2-C-methyl-D-erythritol kinase